MRILVVDDTEASLEAISEMTLSLGHEVIQARNGMDALKSAVETRPHLILMEVRMPELDGHQTAAAIRKISPLVSLPIVMMSAYPEVTSQHSEPMTDWFLNKPIRIDDLSRVLDRFAA